QRALRVRHLGKRLGIGRQGARPGTGWVHEVTLHVEDELFLAELRRCELRFERGLLRDFEEAAVAADTRVRGVECEQRGRCAASGNEKAATALVQPAREALRPFRRERVRM